ncbi:hypothetical protein [Paenibacillus oryzisoli]|uniref:Uncharacterized protein n=1 Tax=Paenibacillus oryzisoli TaxID=1850517 RepID=A0A198A7R3_9BACL|nr:hypothetical protein [Paenibacillus oryzisoli]OAS17145.1 hypothetical protein A8708_02700 [Paenibacillus oryzisoli]
MRWSISYVGVCASVGSLLLCYWFLFENPYLEIAARRDTVLILLAMLVAPAVLGLIASFTNRSRLMSGAFVWSLPYGLYLTVGTIPSIWNLFGLMLACYLIAAIQMRKRL